MSVRSRPFPVAFPELDPRERCKLLCATIIPRPIPFHEPRQARGRVIKIFSADPPLVVLGLQRKPEDARQDTTRNIAGMGEFIINLDEDLAQVMNVCAIEFPPMSAKSTLPA